MAGKQRLGGLARAEKLSPERRREIARMGALAKNKAHLQMLADLPPDVREMERRSQLLRRRQRSIMLRHGALEIEANALEKAIEDRISATRRNA